MPIAGLSAMAPGRMHPGQGRAQQGRAFGAAYLESIDGVRVAYVVPHQARLLCWNLGLIRHKLDAPSPT